MLSESSNDDDCSSSTRSEQDIASARRVGRYVVLGSALPGNGFRSALHLDTQSACSCKVVSHAKLFHLLRPYLELPDHANIVRLVEVLQLDNAGEAFVFFDAAPRLDLHGLLRQRKSLSEPEAVVYFRQIVSAVAHCHENFVVVRDLKLQKFVFSGDDR